MSLSKTLRALKFLFVGPIIRKRHAKCHLTPFHEKCRKCQTFMVRDL